VDPGRERRDFGSWSIPPHPFTFELSNSMLLKDSDYSEL